MLAQPQQLQHWPFSRPISHHPPLRLSLPTQPLRPSTNPGLCLGSAVSLGSPHLFLNNFSLPINPTCLGWTTASLTPPERMTHPLALWPGFFNALITLVIIIYYLLSHKTELPGAMDCSLHSSLQPHPYTGLTHSECWTGWSPCFICSSLQPVLHTELILILKQSLGYVTHASNSFPGWHSPRKLFQLLAFKALQLWLLGELEKSQVIVAIKVKVRQAHLK